MSAEVLSINAAISFGNFDVEINQSLPMSGITAIFGPSGSGKSTLLRLIAGFEQPNSGKVSLGNTTWFDQKMRINIPPHKRSAGYMFQSARLFSHLNVRGNLEYANQRSINQQSQISFEKIVNQFDLQPLLDRQVQKLSGGETQRVALARTLLSRPTVLLLDEPLAALDRKRKQEILPYLQSLSQTFSFPILYVSHDIDEVCQLTDHMLTLDKGRVSAFGSTLEIVNAPEFRLVTDGNDTITLLEGHVDGRDDQLSLTKISVGQGYFHLPIIGDPDVGAKVRLRVKARDVALSIQQPVGVSIQNIIPGTVEKIEPQTNSAYTLVTINIGEQVLRSQITRAAAQALNLKKQMPVYTLIKSASFENLTYDT